MYIHVYAPNGFDVKSYINDLRVAVYLIILSDDIHHLVSADISMGHFPYIYRIY